MSSSVFAGARIFLFIGLIAAADLVIAASQSTSRRLRYVWTMPRCGPADAQPPAFIFLVVVLVMVCGPRHKGLLPMIRPCLDWLGTYGLDCGGSPIY